MTGFPGLEARSQGGPRLLAPMGLAALGETYLVGGFGDFRVPPITGGHRARCEKPGRR